MHIRTDKSFFLLMLTILVWAWPLILLGAENESRDQRRNIIFILADDLGWTDVQAGATGPNVINGTNYGSTYYQTPNIARLAAAGVSFTHCYSQPNCSPTRAAILSGQYAPRSGNGVYHVGNLHRGSQQSGPTALVPPSQRQDIPADHLILPEVLKAAGYTTCHVGKYHVGGKEGGDSTLPLNQGFDFNFGGTDKGGPKHYLAKQQKFHAAIGPSLNQFAGDYSDDYLRINLSNFVNADSGKLLVGTAKHVEDAVGDAAVQFIKNHLSSSADKPFYLQIHHFAVHSPIGGQHARQDLLKKYQRRPSSRYHQHPAYAAILENLDQTVGRVLDCLDDPNGDGVGDDSIRAQTVVMFTSDNGGITPTDNHPLRHVKGSFFEGGIRVPLIVDAGVKSRSGKQSDTLVHCVDFYPTVLEAASISTPDGLKLDGQSFWRVASQNANRSRRPVYYHFPGYLDRRARPCSVVIGRHADKDYKLIYNYDTQYTGNPQREQFRREGLRPLAHPWELYCLTDDLSEQSNLLEGDSTQILPLAKQMAADLAAWLNQDDPDWNPKTLIDRSTKKPIPFPAPVFE